MGLDKQRLDILLRALGPAIADAADDLQCTKGEVLMTLLHMTAVMFEDVGASSEEAGRVAAQYFTLLFARRRIGALQ